jgi:hypothetical protein
MVETTRAASKISLVLAYVDGALVTAEKIRRAREPRPREIVTQISSALNIERAQPPKQISGAIHP